MRRGRLRHDTPDAKVEAHCMEVVLLVCLGTMMVDSWGNTTGGYSFRFFSPEQIDRILREGVKRGRTGSHDAIERILKHEPGLERAQLWREIRRLKQPPNGKLYQRAAWSLEDDQILRKGYQEGWNGKREAVGELLRRQRSWQPHSIWSGAAKLGLVGKSPQKTASVPDSLGPKTTTESFSPWQVTKPRNSSPRPYIDPKMPSVIASLSWARAVAFIWKGMLDGLSHKSCIWAAA